METTKKKLQMPHVFAIMAAMMLLVVVLSWVVPAGTYERAQDPNSGVSVVVPDSFRYVERTSRIGLMDFFGAIYSGIVDSGYISALLFLSAGIIYIIETNGAFTAGIHRMVKKFRGKEFGMMSVFYTVFIIFGVLGYGQSAYPFYPLAIVVAMSLGYDRMAGAAVAIIASTVGFSSGILNMLTVGLAQKIVGLPLYSGIAFRFAGLAVLYIIGLTGIYLYCRKIKSDPTQSYCCEEYLSQKNGESFKQEEALTTRRTIALIGFIGLVILQGVGAVCWGWQFKQVSSVYLIYGIVLAVIFKMHVNDFCNAMLTGAGRMLAVVIATSMARAISILMDQSQILDTVINTMAGMLTNKGNILALLVIYLFITAFNFLVFSGSGKAVMMMPILSPLGQLLGINQQVLVLAYQYGDGLTNSFWPGSCMVELAICGIDYGTWIKFCWKIYGVLIIAAFGLVVIADIIGYGPF